MFRNRKLKVYFYRGFAKHGQKFIFTKQEGERERKSVIELGSKLKEMRLKKNLTQEELADRCELTKGYISQL